MNYFIGISAAFGTLLCWTIGTFAFTQAAKNEVPLIVNRVRLLFAWIVLSIICLFTGIHLFNLFQVPEQFLWLAISGIVGLTIGDYFAFNAFKEIGSSKASLFSTFAPAAALLFGMVILGEQINEIGLFGMSVSLSGITWFVWANGKKSKGKQEHEWKGILFAILGAVCQGVGLVLAKRGMNISPISPIEATWMRMLAAAGITYLIGAFRTNVFKELQSVFKNTKALYPMLVGTAFGPVAGVSFSLLAAQNLEVSLAQTIFSLLPLSVIAFATLSGRETVSRISIFAAIISILGVVILVWRDDIMNTLF
jgi:drug/metabolite transporter (DMT)-like permease